METQTTFQKKWYIKIELVFIIAASFFFFLLIVFLNRNLTFRMDSDYDMSFSYYTNAVTMARTEGSLPRFHPFAGRGLPLAGDPGISYYNPLFMLPIIVLGMEQGTFMILFLSIVLSGLSMWWLLERSSVSTVYQVWGSLLYLTSGALYARFASGHTIFLLSYPIWPIFFHLLTRTQSWKITSILGFLTAYVFLSGDMYGTWFCALFYGSFQFYSLVFLKKRLRSVIRETCFFTVFFFLFSAIKLYFIIVDVIPVFRRSFESSPTAGSIHAFLSFLPFSIPFKVSFYDRPFFQRTLGFHFNWYEYYAFIAPLPLFFCIPMVKNIRKKWLLPRIPASLRLFLFLGIVGVLYVSLKFPYSPFYWVFQAVPQLGLFRVTQRMFLPLSSLVVVFFVHAAISWKRNYPHKHILLYAILGLSILMNGITSLDAARYAFEPPRTRELALVKELSRRNTNNSAVVNFLCCNQTFLVEEHIRVLNFYAGWQPLGTPLFIDKKGTVDPSQLQYTRPRYVLAPNTMDLTQYNYVVIFQSDVGSIWETTQITI